MSAQAEEMAMAGGTEARRADRTESPVKWRGALQHVNVPANSSLPTCGYSPIAGGSRWPTIPSVAPREPIS